MSESALAPTDATPSPRPRAAARQAWVERLERFAHSGLNPAQFCALEGVSLPSFYSWKRRLTAAAPRPATNPLSDAASGPRLLPVRLPGPSTAVELVLPRGAVVRLLPGCDLAFVRSLVEALGDAPC
jgi:transposase